MAAVTKLPAGGFRFGTFTGTPYDAATTARLDTAQTYTKAQRVASVALTDGANIATDASLSNVFTVTLGGNRTLDNPTNLVSGGRYVWIITQDGTGGRTLAYGANFSWPGGITPVQPTAAAAIARIDATYNGTVLVSTISAVSTTPASDPVITSVKTAAYNAVLGDFVRCDPSGGAFTVTLPALATASIGKVINVKNTTSSAGAITIAATGGDTIDTAASTSIAAGFASLSFIATTASTWAIY